MITIKNVEKEVLVKIELFGWTVNFKQEKEDGLSALLLAKSLYDKMGIRLEAIRREAYFHGYKDGRAKARKETWFSKGW